ncbi:hypothetical protein [Peptoniphilus phoceensis]|nr:hypothetical protein [Peptoniphilus phoceensis]
MMGNYDVETRSVECWVICGGGCALTCFADSGVPVLDAVGISLSYNDDLA